MAAVPRVVDQRGPAVGRVHRLAGAHVHLRADVRLFDQVADDATPRPHEPAVHRQGVELAVHVGEEPATDLRADDGATVDVVAHQLLGVRVDLLDRPDRLLGRQELPERIDANRGDAIVPLAEGVLHVFLDDTKAHHRQRVRLLVVLRVHLERVGHVLCDRVPVRGDGERVREGRPGVVVVRELGVNERSHPARGRDQVAVPPHRVARATVFESEPGFVLEDARAELAVLRRVVDPRERVRVRHLLHQLAELGLRGDGERELVAVLVLGARGVAHRRRQVDAGLRVPRRVLERFRDARAVDIGERRAAVVLEVVGVELPVASLRAVARALPLVVLRDRFLAQLAADGVSLCGRERAVERGHERGLALACRQVRLLQDLHAREFQRCLGCLVADRVDLITDVQADVDVDAVAHVARGLDLLGFGFRRHPDVRVLQGERARVPDRGLDLRGVVDGEVLASCLGGVEAVVPALLQQLLDRRVLDDVPRARAQARYVVRVQRDIPGLRELDELRNLLRVLVVERLLRPHVHRHRVRARRQAVSRQGVEFVGRVRSVSAGDTLRLSAYALPLFVAEELMRVILHVALGGVAKPLRELRVLRQEDRAGLLRLELGDVARGPVVPDVFLFAVADELAELRSVGRLRRHLQLASALFLPVVVDLVHLAEPVTLGWVAVHVGLVGIRQRLLVLRVDAELLFLARDRVILRRHARAGEHAVQREPLVHRPVERVLQRSADRGLEIRRRVHRHLGWRALQDRALVRRQVVVRPLRPLRRVVVERALHEHLRCVLVATWRVVPLGHELVSDRGRERGVHGLEVVDIRRGDSLPVGRRERLAGDDVLDFVVEVCDRLQELLGVALRFRGADTGGERIEDLGLERRVDLRVALDVRVDLVQERLARHRVRGVGVVARASRRLPLGGQAFRDDLQGGGLQLGGHQVRDLVLADGHRVVAGVVRDEDGIGHRVLGG